MRPMPTRSGWLMLGVFADVRPAATMVVVAGLIDPAMLVEVEVTAWVGEPDRTSGSVPR